MKSHNALNDNSIFVEIFGTSPIIKVLDFMIEGQAFDYSLTEIAKNSGISYSSLQSLWDRLVRNNIVVKTRRVGKSDLFKLNKDNPAVKQLIELDWNLTKNAKIELE